MPRPQSNIWQYFTIVPGPYGRGRKAQCNFCTHQQACGVTRLHQHLLRKCTKIPETLHEELLQKEAARGKALTVQATERSVMTQEVLQILQQRQQQQRQQQQSSSSSSYQTIEIDRALSTIASNSLAGGNLSNNSGPYRAAAASTSSSLSSSNNNNNSNNNGNSTRYENLSSPSSPSPHQYSSHHHHHHRHTANSQSHHSSSNSNSTSDAPGNLASSDPMSQRMLDYNLARALFSASIPFNVVDNQEFASFLKRMRPGYAVPKSHVLQEYLLKEEHYDLIQQEPQQHQHQQQQQQNSTLTSAFDSSVSNNGIAPRSPSSSTSAPSTSSSATITRIIHTHNVNGGGTGSSNSNGNNGNNNNNSSNQHEAVNSSSSHHHSNHNPRASLMHRTTEMDGGL